MSKYFYPLLILLYSNIIWSQGSPINSNNTKPTIVSLDKDDYQPGETAIITGINFSPNENVTLQVLHADGTPSTGADHDPWTTAADANGNIKTSWHVCEDDCKGSILRLTAKGLSSNYITTANFTDASSFMYVGSFKVGDGPCWHDPYPVTYTAREAAALLFGGSPNDYAISVNQNTTDETTISHTAWVDGYADETYLHTPASEDFKENSIYNYPAFSAYVKDHSDGTNDLSRTYCNYNGYPTYINYVWRIKPHINTSISLSQLCELGSYQIGYSSNGTFSSGNVFTAELSDENGSFTNPVTIGSTSSLINGSINITIPSGTIPGSGYRIRVVSSSPVIIGIDNGTNIIINGLPNATITPDGPTTFCPSASVNLNSSQGDSYLWSNGATVSGINVTSSGSYTVKVTTNGCSKTSDPVLINVQDIDPPVITSNGNKTVNNDAGKCGASVVVSATASDNCSVGNPTGVRSDAKALTDDYPTGTTTIRWNVTDANGNPATEVVQTVTINNAAPVLNSISATLDPIPVNTAVSLNVSYTDNNVTSASIVWGDGSATQNISTPALTFVPQHTYSAAGVYSVNVTLKDACNSTVSQTYQYIVIYDPNAGFVTGGGWINSPAGAYIPDQTLIGKASFGFVSKYQKGATVPSGNTSFKFETAGMSFISTSYDWLVISGSRAQYKGSGTINGTGNYGFLLTAVDGDLTTPVSPDLFRIKIWDKASGAIVYDNQYGSSDDAALTTAIGGGSIVIHTSTQKARVAPAVTEDSPKGALNMIAMPNPTRNYFSILVNSQSNMPLSIRVTDLLGRLIESKDEVPANSRFNVGENYKPGVYIIQAIQGTDKQVLRLVKGSD